MIFDDDFCTFPLADHLVVELKCVLEAPAKSGCRPCLVAVKFRFIFSDAISFHLSANSIKFNFFFFPSPSQQFRECRSEPTNHAFVQVLSSKLLKIVAELFIRILQNSLPFCHFAIRIIRSSSICHRQNTFQCDFAALNEQQFRSINVGCELKL